MAKKSGKSGKHIFGKVISIILVILLTLVTVALMVAGVMAKSLGTAERGAELAANPHGFQSLAICPEYEGAVKLPKPLNSMSEQELKEFTQQLYETAGYNYKAHDVTTYERCKIVLTAMEIDNFLNLDAVAMKTDDEYFRIEYRLPDECPFLKLGSMIGFPNLDKQINDGFEMVLTERSYVNNAKDPTTMTYQKVKNANLGEGDVPYSVWDQPSEYPITEEERVAPVFSDKQDGFFHLSAHKVEASTIDKVSIEHKTQVDGLDMDGYYEVTMSLNVKTSTTDSVKNIIAGTHDENAHYTQLDFVFTVWDNGYIRTFTFVEHWEARVMGFISFGSVFEYSQVFSYDPKDIDMHNYKDYKDMMSALNAK